MPALNLAEYSDHDPTEYLSGYRDHVRRYTENHNYTDLAFIENPHSCGPHGTACDPYGQKVNLYFYFSGVGGYKWDAAGDEHVAVCLNARTDHSFFPGNKLRAVPAPRQREA